MIERCIENKTFTRMYTCSLPFRHRNPFFIQLPGHLQESSIYVKHVYYSIHFTESGLRTGYKKFDRPNEAETYWSTSISSSASPFLRFATLLASPLAPPKKSMIFCCFGSNAALPIPPFCRFCRHAVSGMIRI